MAIVARLQGGLGNQLFIYCSAKRLALKLNQPLKVDLSFSRDRFKRHLGLRKFNINLEVVQGRQSYEGLFGEVRRRAAKFINSQMKFQNRWYIFEEKPSFDERLLSLTSLRGIYLDGCWQSEAYFSDVEATLREELKIISPISSESLSVADKIYKSKAVAIHLRLLHGLPAGHENPEDSPVSAVHLNYFRQAMEYISDRIEDPVFFCFSDCPEWVRERFVTKHEVILIEHNQGEERSFEDLWLMAQCQHQIIANSTFSWWGAWFARHKNQIVLAPGQMANWGHDGLIPASWITMNPS